MDNGILKHFIDDYSSRFGLETRIGLLTGQSLPIFRCGRERRFNADRHVLNDQ
jgi:hypothetical protein